ncbi:MAG: hypothetical protein Q8R15_02120 [Candidatus Micrarchaeota archaeon]|nr:hypothetical protein [Candidatus Micrarchaeota archaeon]
MFITQEIGSIQRPIWRQKLDAPSNKEWIASAVQWGEKVNVDPATITELQGILQKDGKTRTVEEKQRIVDIASIYVIKMFETIGLDRVFNGEQPRTEMYDFLAQNTDGIEAAGTLNAFDANYFKKGKITGPLSVKPKCVDFFVNEFNFVKQHTKKTVKPCLTGPYTMADWSYIEYHRQQFEAKGETPLTALQKGRGKAVLDFAKNVLNPIVTALAKAGAKVIQIDEPGASTNEQESELFVEAVNESFKGIPNNVEKAVHLCYSNYSALFPALSQCTANSYLIEFTNHASPTEFKPTEVNPESFKAIELFKENNMEVNIGVGVIDIHSDLIEKPEAIRDRLLYAAKLIGDPAKVQVNPDCGLRTRKWEVAHSKLQNMVKGAQLAKNEYGG